MTFTEFERQVLVYSRTHPLPFSINENAAAGEASTLPTLVFLLALGRLKQSGVFLE